MRRFAPMAAEIQPVICYFCLCRKATMGTLIPLFFWCKWLKVVFHKGLRYCSQQVVVLSGRSAKSDINQLLAIESRLALPPASENPGFFPAYKNFFWWQWLKFNLELPIEVIMGFLDGLSRSNELTV